ncbi:uracil-DNA glycosylase [Suhomyces tanzawaensis NRRL Y-17324]|uniref:Uracil-DNA glycosylase n=1 Tax=Suhomyces tanzawaensis NRRL Y-17324 TaxID=984487 RepID=A0A1E4SIP4_9ASCO|nr:uracil-DNA glycosylase [Suhomyces tanzawaensis NRRL Y-17324]ODV79302.1 uracil-DNA glycosylase [Suhomyces tanzawaensis NRRL Y-17324]
MKRPNDSPPTRPKKLITDFFKHQKPSKEPITPQITPESRLAVENGATTELAADHTNPSTKDTNEPVHRGLATKSAPNASKGVHTPKIGAFDKEKWVLSLTPEQQALLQLEIDTLHESWLGPLHKELTKPYFLQLKRFLQTQGSKTVFPKPHDIYSWSHYTPLPNVKCLILGQDPYHNHNQAHGLAFSVLEPTRPPPSLLNIYKTIHIDYPNFEIPEYAVLQKQGHPGGGNLTKWAQRGVLMLNAVLTVECHKANSHAKQGWETFTEQVIRVAIDHHAAKGLGFVIMAWGTPAQLRVAKVDPSLHQNPRFLVLKTVHPSPLSARRGFFDLQVFKKCNSWLHANNRDKIDWGLLANNVVL